MNGMTVEVVPDGDSNYRGAPDALRIRSPL